MEKDEAKSGPEPRDGPAPLTDPEPAQPAANPPLSSEEVREQAKKVIDTARDTIARTHQVADRTRQTVQKTEETLQHIRARKERRAEQQALRTTAAIGPTERLAQSPNRLEILLIEDNPGDSRLFQEALTEGEIPCQVSLLTDSSVVLAFIHRERAFVQIPQPQLIVLDLTLPGMNPEEVLAALRSVLAYQTVPVILFSSGDETSGQQRSVQLGAAAFVQKPIDLQKFFVAVQDMVKIWGLAGRPDTLLLGR
jgi:CheY-like chemotaxis protein